MRTKYRFAFALVSLMILIWLANPMTAERMLKSSRTPTGDVAGLVATSRQGSTTPGAIVDPTAATAEPLPAASPVDATGYIKGIYVSYGALGSTELMDHVKNLLETTELNAVVMDFKGDRAYLSFPTNVPTAVEIGADEAPVVTDAAAFLSWFQEHKVHTIARIVVFKDDKLATAYPEWAVTDATTGLPWRDGEDLAWTDPSLYGPQAYNVQLAVEAAEMGFDEVQFDYVRFPSDGSLGNAIFSQDMNEDGRATTIAGFLESAHQALSSYGVLLSADVFGYAAWMDELGIGQTLSMLAPHVDVICPMAYPSTYASGLPGLSEDYSNAIAYPYDIVSLSTQRAYEKARVSNPSIVIRPWLQDFQDYAFDFRVYTPDEIRDQMNGARDGGGRGWLLWDPSVQYTPEALVSSEPHFAPNTNGRVPVLTYRGIGLPESDQMRSPDGFRSDLERLLSEGYFPVTMREMVEGELKMVPAGKRPVVLAFVGDAAGQYPLDADGYAAADSAIGILRRFHDEHQADWPMSATFFLPASSGDPNWAPFGQSDTAQLKLQVLVARDVEIGLDLGDGVDATSLTSQQLTQTLASGVAELQSWLPGYQPFSLAISSGVLPANLTSSLNGQSGNISFGIGAVLGSGVQLAPAPGSTAFNPYAIPRIPASASEGKQWLDSAAVAGVGYVSAGE